MATNGMLYGIIGALGVAVVGAGVYIAKEQGAFDGQTTQATAPAPVATPAPLPRPSPPVAAPQPPAAVPQTNQVNLLVTDARRAITRGDFASADRALDQAERLDPRSPDVIAARRDLRDAERTAGRQDRRDERRVDALVAEARAAIARRDYGAADQLLDQAERIDARDRDVQQARAELNAQRPGPQRPDRDQGGRR